MTQGTPSRMDVTDVQFKLQNKLNLFRNQNPPLDNCNLLASASTRGVVFVGGYEAHLLVCPLSSLTNKDVTEEKLPHFKLQLPSHPHLIALSCDDAYLAVNVEVKRMCLILVYSVESIINQQPKILEQIKLTSEENVRAKQILWNPVQNNIFSGLLENGGMVAYMIQEKGVHFNMLDKAEQAQCACWSPKGKQIVVGFRNGKIVQYKPDLKPARVIQCPPGTFGNSFQTIAIQWLSTYQFATLFLSDDSPDATPFLHIVNAPKAGPPSIRNYGDICYSSPGPRKAQAFLIHLAQWNILLQASANSMEVGILGTDETGDFPNWSQWITSDEARAELPLTEDKDDTYPIGFCIETGCTHNVFQGETILPIMPMIHLLSTHGIFISFNIVNLKPTYVDVCSPPRPLPDGLQWEIGVRKKKPVENLNSSELSFASPTSQSIFQTSTPANEKSFFPSPSEPPKSISSNLFGGNIPLKSNAVSEINKPTILPANSQSSMFGLPNPMVQPQFSSSFNMLGGGQAKSSVNLAVQPQPKINQPLPTLVPQNQNAPLKPMQKITKPAEPIITVQPTFNKNLPVSDSKTTQSVLTMPSPVVGMDIKSDDGTIAILITEEIQSFERDLKELLNRTKSGKELESNEKFFTTDYKNMVGTLSELQDTMAQAMEATENLKTDIHSVRLSLNESFAMQTEAQSKYNIYNEPDYVLLHENAGKNQTNQKQLSKLKSMLKTNEIQFNEIYKIVYSQFSNFEETKKQQNRDRIKIPSLQLVYQSLNKQQDLIQHKRRSLNLVKQQIGLNSSLISRSAAKSNEESTIESLTDSIISLSIADRVKAETSRFTEAKKKNLLDYLKNREVQIIQQSRPENEFLISKIINGRKAKTTREKEDVAAREIPKATVIPQNPRIGMVPLGSRGPHVYKPSPVTATQDSLTQLSKFSGFSTPVPQTSEQLNNTNVDRKKKEGQKTPTTTLPIGQPLVFSGSGSGGFNFNPPNTNTISIIKKSEPDNIPSQTTTFVEHNQKPSPNFGFGSATSLFGNTNVKDIPKLQDIKTKPNIHNTLPPPMFPSKSLDIPKPNSSKFTLQDVSNADTKTITSMPSGVDFSLGSGLSITKLGEKPTNIPPQAQFHFNPPTTQDKSVVEFKDTTENTPLEAKQVDSSIKQVPNLQSQPVKVPPSVPTALSIFQSIDVSSSAASIMHQSSPVITTSTPFTVTTALPVTVTTTTVTTAVSVVTAATVTTASVPFSFGSGTGPSFSFANAFAEKSEMPATSEPSTDNILQGINICKPTATTTVSITKPENIFAPALSSFGNSTLTTTSIFGGQTTITATSTSQGFGSVPTNATVAQVTPVTGTTSGLTTANAPFGVINLSASTAETNVFSGFGAPSTTTATTSASVEFQTVANTTTFGTGSSIFGGTPVTTTTTSQAPPTNLFGSALSFGGTSASGTASSLPSPFALKTIETTAVSSPFGGITNTSIFGGAGGNTTPSTLGFAFSNAVSNNSTIFGGAASGDSVFEMVATSAPPTSSIFGTPINSSATSGGSLFGSGFGASPPNSSSIFGGSNSAISEAQPNSFSFAQKSDSTVFASPSAFGQTAPSFGSPTGGAFTATPQPAPAFRSLPSFGGGAFGNTSPTFGGPATFGTTPTFGGTATFMSPTKSSFGAFGVAAAANQPQSPSFGGGGTPQQQNTLFEQLGSSDNALSFGNLAQTANSNQNKPPFGGSAFMSWR